MWDKYLSTILKLTSDTDNTKIYKRNLLRQSMINAHKKKKMKPIHYIEWVRDKFYFYKLFFTILSPLIFRLTNLAVL